MLAVFVALSIALLTAYFGESAGGVFHTLQRGAQEAFAPIESGASRALKPVRDLVGWAGDTIDAKGENKELKKEVEELRSDLAEAQTAEREAGQLRAIVGAARSRTGSRTARAGHRARDRPLADRLVLERADRQGHGRRRARRPARDHGRRPGRARSPASPAAPPEVRADHRRRERRVGPGDPEGRSGVVRPEVGDPNDLLLEYIESDRRVTENTLVITSGFTSSRLESLFPRGIPIGRVEQRRRRRARELPARARQAVRRLPPAGLRRRCSRAAAAPRWPPSCRGRAGDPLSGRLPPGRLLLLLAVVLQMSGLSQIRILGGHADLVVLVVAAVAYYAGSVSGSVAGFAAGFLLDLLIGATLGASSLVLTVVGYGVGRFREERDPSHGLMPIPVGAAATAAWVTAFAAVSFMLDIGAQRQPARAPRHDRDGAAQRAARPARLHRRRASAAPVAGRRPARVRRRRKPPREAGPLGLRGLEV